ncbi:MAG: flippase-like domain-containing protein [Gammaproteobacteria bacterium]|nr:flippase-like domain-containing protein [Gammaproteobacteria bacterium]
MSTAAPTPAPARPRGRALRLLASVLLTVILLVTVEWLVGWRATLAIWLQLGPLETLPAVLLVLLSYLLRGLRLARWMDARPSSAPRPNVPALAATVLILRHNLLNVLLPFRSGEAAFPLLMHQQFQVGLRESLLLLLWLRVLDLLMLLGCGLAALLVITAGTLPALAALTAALLVTLLLRWLSGIVQVRLAAGAATRSHEALWPDRLRGLLLQLCAHPPAGHAWWSIVMLGWGNWLAKLLAYGWVLMLLLDCPPMVALLAAATGELSSVLPVHGIAGAGTYEAGILAGLIPLGIDARSGLAAAVNLHLFMLACAVLAGLIGFLPWNAARREQPLASAPGSTLEDRPEGKLAVPPSEPRSAGNARADGHGAARIADLE